MTPEKVIRVIFYIGLPCDIGRCLIVRILSDDEPGVADGHALDNDIALIALVRSFSCLLGFLFGRKKNILSRHSKFFFSFGLVGKGDYKGKTHAKPIAPAAGAAVCASPPAASQ